MNNTQESSASAWMFRNFRLYTYGAVLLPFASQIQTLIIGWQVYQIKHDPLFLGFIGLIEALPALSLALVSGYIVDKSNPLIVFKNVVRLALFSAILLTTLSSPWVLVSNAQKLPWLYVAAFLAGVGRGFRMPANTALVPRLVPRHALHISSAWNTSGFAIASSLGPALGGFMYAWKGTSAPYDLNVVVLVIALIFISRIQIESHELKSQEKENEKVFSAFHRLTAGMRYVYSHQLLLSALTLDMFAVLFGGAVALLPIFAGEVLHVGPLGLGILRSAPSVGAIFGGLLLIRFPVRRHSGKILLATVAGFGLCMIGFGYSHSFLFSLILLSLGGAFDSVSMVIRGAIVQLSAPPEMRGRVGAVNSIFIGVSNQLGEFESGVLAKLMGTAPSVVFGGIVTLIVVSITAVIAPKLRKMELSKL